MDLDEEVLMIALLHKEISKNETSPPVLGLSSALYVGNSISKLQIQVAS
jgi:hypothetical protein